MSTLEIANVGPIVSLEVSIPDDKPGGVMLFRGDNGTGKTNGINAVRALLGGKVRLVPREIVVEGGTAHATAHATGTVKLGERKVTVDGATRRTGDLEVSTIEGRFDVFDLVSPSYDDAEARDETRVKALIDVAGVKPDIKLFYDLAGGKAVIDALLTPKEQDAKDLVGLGKRLKSKLEAKAREFETIAESADGNARTAAAAADGVDMDAPHDADALTVALTTATTKIASLKQQRTNALAARQQAETAKAKLAEHEKSAVTVEDAAAAYENAQAAFKAAVARRDQIKADLQKAEEDLRVVHQSATDADKAVQLAKQAEAAVTGWRDQIAEAGKMICPDDADIAAVEQDEKAARQAIDVGALVRHAKSKLTEADGYKEKAAESRKTAELYRNQAAAVFGVLSKQIPEGPLYLDAGQLVVDTADRKAEPYDRLSEGERGKIAAQYAIDAVGDGGMVCLPQPCWDGFSPESKLWLAKYSEEHGVWVFTGEAASGPLRAEEFQPSNAELSA